MSYFRVKFHRMGMPERPSVLVEIGALLNYRRAEIKKNRWEESADHIAKQTFAYLLAHEPTFAAHFPSPENITPTRLGRGWHNMAYKVGDRVIKIPHSEGPVPGFDYPPTQEGVALARYHLDSLRTAAKRHNLPHLIRDDEAVYLVKGDKDAGTADGVVSVQKYFVPFVAAKDFPQLHASVAEKQRLIDEFRRFIDMSADLRRNQGLRIDNFGFANLAITRGDDRELHFVLGDTQPADHTRAGNITEFGLDTMVGKEIIMWSWALGIGNTLRRLIS